MKITGYHVEHYLMKMDRLVGDANLPSGVEMLPGSILNLETDENVTGISLGYGGGNQMVGIRSSRASQVGHAAI